MKRTMMLAIPAALLLVAVFLGGPAISSAQAHPSTFPDVAEAHPAHVAIETLAAKDIVAGTLTGEFLPDKPVTRVQAAKILVTWRGAEVASGTTGFSDVDAAGVPYAETVLTEGWMSGYPDGTFRPYDPLTRQQMAVIAVQSLGLEAEALASTDSQIAKVLGVFADRGAISPAARPYMALAVTRGLLGGNQGHVYPVARVTRAQFSLVIYRADIVAQGGTIDTASLEMASYEAPPEDVLTASEKAQAKFMDVYLFQPRNSPVTGEMVVQNAEWYGIPVLSQLVIMAAETSLGDPSQGGSLARHYNFGCLRYHGSSTSWGLLSAGKIWVGGKDWYSFATPQIGMAAFGRYLKTGVKGFYAPILKATHPDWDKFAGVYYGRGVSGISSYVSRLHTLENRFRNMAAEHGVTL